MQMLSRGKVPHFALLSLTFRAQIDYTPPSAFPVAHPARLRMRACWVAAALGCM